MVTDDNISELEIKNVYNYKKVQKVENKKIICEQVQGFTINDDGNIYFYSNTNENISGCIFKAKGESIKATHLAKFYHGNDITYNEKGKNY